MTRQRTIAQELADDLYDRMREAAQAQRGGASMVEIRWDLIDEDEWTAARELVRQQRGVIEGDVLTVGFNLVPPWLRDLHR